MIGLSIALALFSMPKQAAPPQPVAAATAEVDPARLALAKQVLDATHIETQYDTIFSRLIPVMSVQIFDSLKDNIQLPAMVRQRLADPERLSAAERIFAEEAMAGFKARYAGLKLATAREYAAAFTVEELTQLLAFYRGPVGQKALQVLPALQAKLMPIGMATGGEVGEAAIKRTFERLDLALPEKPKA